MKRPPADAVLLPPFAPTAACRIEFAKLPSRARAAISRRQPSCIDEFRFYKNPETLDIAAWYAGCHLATWNGKMWISALFAECADGWKKP